MRDQAAKLERGAARKRAARQQRDTPAATVERLEHNAARKRAAKQRETPAATVERLERNAARKRAARQCETPAATVERLERNAARERAAKQRETPTATVERLERNAARKRAAKQRETAAPTVERLERNAARKRAAKQRETPAAKVARCECHAATTRAARTATQVSLDARLQEITEGILERRVVDLDTLQLIASNQNWTKHPHLALVYFHCCANHPDAFVCNDESLRSDAGAAVRDRLLRAIDAPPGVEEAIRCQASVREHDSGSASHLVLRVVQPQGGAERAKDARVCATRPAAELLGDRRRACTLC